MRAIYRLKCILAAFLVIAAARIVWAGCKSDCRDEYTAEVESCNRRYDEPDDADDLRRCVENAKETYDGCVEECEN